jgi:hypothetical protein
MPILHCEIGNHDWERESKRGRLPKNCPEHSPIKDEIKLIHSNQFNLTLADIKESSEEKWEKLLPGVSDYLNEKTRIYHCEHGEGHDWTGESKRGRPPRFCPEHRELYSEGPKLRGDRETTKSMQEAIERIINAPTARSCHCGITPQMSTAEIRALGCGCCGPWYICSTLDSVRRTLNL